LEAEPVLDNKKAPNESLGAFYENSMKDF